MHFDNVLWLVQTNETSIVERKRERERCTWSWGFQQVNPRPPRLRVVRRLVFFWGVWRFEILGFSARYSLPRASLAFHSKPFMLKAVQLILTIFTTRPQVHKVSKLWIPFLDFKGRTLTFQCLWSFCQRSLLLALVSSHWQLIFRCLSINTARSCSLTTTTWKSFYIVQQPNRSRKLPNAGM